MKRIVMKACFGGALASAVLIAGASLRGETAAYEQAASDSSKSSKRESALAPAPVAQAGTSALSASASATPVGSAGGSSATATTTPSALTLGQAQQEVAKTPVRYPAHPSAESYAAKHEKEETETPIEKPDFSIAVPPPPTPPENKPPAPRAHLVWVPGHFMPVKGQWVWVAGAWSVPATPSSVWMEASYDAKENRWTPGYWQPDRPAAPEPDVASKDPARLADFTNYR